MAIDFTQQITVRREVLFEGAFYTEGPVCDDQGGIYFTDLTGGTLWYWRRESGALRCVEGGWPNGQARDSMGNWLVCDSKTRQLRRYDAKGNFTGNVVDGHCAGKPVTTPNDVITDSGGGFYFTDSVRHRGYVFYRSNTGAERVVAEGLDYPNGLVLSADERHLFVAESYANRLVRVQLDGPGGAADWDVFCELPYHASGHPQANLPDGLAIDSAGNVWVAHYGMGALQVVDKQGKLLASIPTGIPLTSNVCLLEPDSLIVTGGDAEPGPGRVVKLTLTTNEHDE